MLCLYGPILLSLAAPLARAFNGRRNAGRPFEAVTDLCLALAAIWLLMVFPFNFSHLADPLPAAIRFFLAWVTNDIGRVIFILQVIVGLMAAIVTTVIYLSVRHRSFPNTA